MGTHVWRSAPQERNTANRDRGTGRETYGLGNVCGKGHVIAEDRIETIRAGIDAVTDHVIVTVVTLIGSLGLFRVAVSRRCFDGCFIVL